MTRLYKLFTAGLLCLIVPIMAHAQLGANFVANSTTGCNPMVVQFTNLSTGSPTSYSWNFGNSTTSTLQNPSTTYTAPGTYTVSLTISNGSGSDTKTITNYITVYPPPTVDFSTNDTAGCPPHTASFLTNTTLNAPGAGTYLWNFGTGPTVSGQNPTHTFQNPGYYNITHVVVSSVGCTTSVVKTAYVHVFTPPVADFSTPFPILCGTATPAPFTPSITGTAPFSYYWEFGDGGTSTAQNPSHSYNAIGSYTVKLLVTDANGCKDTVVKTNYITVVSQQGTFTAPVSACEGAMLTFTNTTPFTIYCNWNFGDGSPSDTNQVAYHTYTAPGTYTVTLTVNNGTCFVYASQNITIHPLPSIDFLASNLSPCPAPATISFTNQTTNGGTYTWDFGDNTPTSTQTNPTHTYTANGSYDITLTATNSFGCSSQLTKYSYVNIYPLSVNMNITPGNGCIPLTDTFSASISTGSNPYPSTISSYSWDFGDGGTSTQANPVHIYNNVGVYQVKLNIMTSNGCSDSALMIVQAGTPPNADFTANPIVNCVDQPIQFINNTTNANTYQWLFGNGGSSSAQDPVHAYDSAGIYTVTLIAGNNGCMDTIIKTNYITINDPKAKFTMTYFCDTVTKVQFNNTSVNYTSCTWDFGDGNSSAAVNPVHIYQNTGTYTATLVAFNTATGCIDTQTHAVELFNPSTSFTANDTAICPDATITFTANPGNPALIDQYNWIFDGSSLNDTSMIINYTYYTPGWHHVSLITIDQHGCPDTFTRNNYIIVGRPAVNFNASDTQLCVPGTTTFSDASVLPFGTTPVSFAWSFGDGTLITTVSPNVTHTYTTAGAFPIRLIVTDNIGCIDSLSKPQYITVQDPTASFSVASTDACVGAPKLFLSNSQGVQLTYYWDFGDGNTSNLSVPQHIYTQPGTYTVTLVVTDNIGCKDTMIRTNYITVYDKPHAAFTVSDTFRICAPLIVQTTNLSTGGYIYNWDMGDGTTNTAVNPSHIYLTPGVYTIRLTAINQNGCRDTAYRIVTLLGYDGAFTYTPLTGCAPLTVTFNANVSNVPGFVWDFSDGTTLATTATTVTHTYLNPGPVIPRLIMTDNAGCTAASNGADTIKVDGVYAGFTYDPYPACDFGTLTFTDTSHGAYSTVNSRIWLFHDGQLSTATSPSRFYPGPGDYIIKLFTSTNTGCLDTLTDTLTFYPLPVIDAGPDTTICLGDSATFFPGGGVSYTWSPPVNLSCINCTNPFASPVTETLYTVTGTDINGCTNTDSVRVKLKTKTVSTVTGEGEICEGESLQLHATGARQYEWLPGTWLNNSHIADPVSTPASSITYTVIAREGSCIPDTNVINIIVHPKPSVDAGPDQTIVAGESALLSATGTHISTYKWSPAESLSCETCSDPEATPKNTTHYEVVAYSDFGCRDTDQVTIFVVCKDGQVYMPNSFTPNGDGQNDKFYPRGKGLQIIRSFRIYNRWGELVFEKRDINENEINNGWDGTYKGVLLNPDVFIYIVDAVCDTGEPVSWKGDISLIR